MNDCNKQPRKKNEKQSVIESGEHDEVIKRRRNYKVISIYLNQRKHVTISTV